MLTKGAVEDLIYEHLSRADRGGAAPAGKKPAPVKKTFISDWELRRLYKPGSSSVAVPVNAILSPLSLDWLDYNGVKVVRN
ncbi:MAG TPA: hypothetical protein DCW72_06460 [Elusimicrobia bacterium]|nr:MAG: hypothetical protein A2X29_05430 [Elusimicrobia bacterium GWA2_64_40]OGR63349.1 MAG: hypothetical protein A2X30_02195 [Elusimicrobia bacterium GWB2_63_16]HAN04099.1 hypothetical protein [Elusimicrobiota bacterium]HAU89863.1 hypothetical protein [Elusimicrobiota bacterium]